MAKLAVMIVFLILLLIPATSQVFGGAVFVCPDNGQLLSGNPNNRHVDGQDNVPYCETNPFSSAVNGCPAGFGPILIRIGTTITTALVCGIFPAPTALPESQEQVIGGKILDINAASLLVGTIGSDIEYVWVFVPAISGLILAIVKRKRSHLV